MVMCFSLKSNIPNTLTGDEPKNSITCINGIRVLSIGWVVLGKAYVYSA